MKSVLSAIFAMLLLASCSPSPPASPTGSSSEGEGSHVMTVTTPEILSEYPHAGLAGTLLAEQEGEVIFFILETDDQRHGLVLPAGYHASVVGETIQLMSDTGEPMAEVGSDIWVGGGEAPEGTEWANRWGDGPQVDGYWLAGHLDFSTAEE